MCQWIEDNFFQASLPIALNKELIIFFKKLMEYVHIDQWRKGLKNIPDYFWKTHQVANFWNVKFDLL